MIPKNLVPYFAYEPVLAASKEVFAKNILLKGLSGRGAHRDEPHIQRAVYHSLKEHPEVLQMYLTGKA